MDKEMLEQIAQMLEDQTRRIEIKIENEVSRKIEALFDGYKLTHEKQWELERRADQMQNQIDDLKARLSALESKTA